MAEREITEPVELCRPDGRLNPDSVGWSRHPLHGTSLRGWGRSKRWEYWGLVTPAYILGITVSSLDYAGVHSVYLLDRASGSETNADAPHQPACHVRGGCSTKAPALYLEPADSGSS